MKYSSTRKLLPVVLIGLLFTTSAVGQMRRRGRALSVRPAAAKVRLVLGNPSNATADIRARDNFLLVKPQFVLSYNDTKGGANWVSWHLQKSDIGGVDRGDFHADPDLPAGFKRVTKADYTRTGFDRGHLCNSKDRTSSRAHNDATFSMTNILPQRPDNNQGPWRLLEDFGRTLARQGNELYITAGAFGSTGSITRGKVNVPKTFWKVMVVLPQGPDDLRRIDANTRAIAVCMPNTQGIRRKDWREYVTTIRNVESATGFDFLSTLPREVQDAIETRADAEGIAPPGANPCQQ